MATQQLASDEAQLLAVRREQSALVATLTARLNAANAAIRGVADSLTRATKAASVAAKPLGAGGTPGTPGADGDGKPDKMKGSFDALGAGIENAFNRGLSALRSFVAVADPSTFATLTGSVELLGQQMGTLLLPATEFLSASLQSAANFMASLDESTKGTIARVAVAALVFGGLVVAFRTIAAVVAAARVAVLAFGTALTTTPIGALLTLVGVIGSIAAAWGIAGEAAKGAKGAFTDASRVEARRGGAVTEREFTDEEVSRLPAEWKEKFERLDKDRVRIIADTEGKEQERQTQLADNDAARLRVTREYLRDPKALQRTLPASVQAEIERDPTNARQAVSDYLRKAEGERDEWQSKLPAAVESDTKDRERVNKIMQDVLNMAGTRLAVETQVSLYRKNRGLGQDSKELPSPDSEEFKQILTAIGRRMVNEDEGLKDIATISELRKYITLAPPTGNRAFADVVAKPLPPPGDSQVNKVENMLAGWAARINLTKDLVTKIGEPKSDILRDWKMPFQSRFMSDFASYQESITVAANNQSDLQAQKLTAQLENLAKVIGDASNLLRTFRDKANAGGSNNSWLFSPIAAFQ